MRLLLAGGGTGGHLFPAVAMADRLLETEPDAEVLFVGTRRGIEAQVLPELGLPLRTVDIAGFMGKSLASKMALVPKLVKSVMQSLGILAEFRPDVIVGVGGYASAPVLLAGRIRKVPLVIHEQNAWPGLTNRLLARWADRVCLSIAEADRAFHRGRTVISGNPLRRGMENCPPIPSGTPRLLVFGGSRGARAINDAVVEMLPLLDECREKLEIVHQTGNEDYERVCEGYSRAGRSAEGVQPFIREMSAAYAGAHLVLCRAGATTVAELVACGRPAVMVPYPYAAADHQTANARALVQKGAALMLPESEINAPRLARVIGDLLEDRERLQSMAAAARALGRPGAADRVLQECRSVIRERKMVACSK